MAHQIPVLFELIQREVFTEEDGHPVGVGIFGTPVLDIWPKEGIKDVQSSHASGMQSGALLAAAPYALPLKFRLLPEYFNMGFNFSSHMVGKWHLGSCRERYVPTKRGFESHTGYWTGKEDYYQHINLEGAAAFRGYDFRRNLSVAWDNFGSYATDLFTAEAERVIERHAQSDAGRPLFLYLAHLAVHSGNSEAPLQVLVSSNHNFHKLLFTSVLRFAHAGRGEPFVLLGTSSQ